MLTLALALLFASLSTFLSFIYADDVEAALERGRPADGGTRFVVAVMFPAVLLIAIPLVIYFGVFSKQAETIRENVRSFLQVIAYGRA